MANHCKTIIFLNLRFSDFYSPELLKRVKEKNNIKLVAILDQQFKDRIGPHIEPYLDHIHVIPSLEKNGFLAEFDYRVLHDLVNLYVNTSTETYIVCSDEFNLLNAGRLRREFGLFGNTDPMLLPFRDKIKMKQILIDAGIRVPKFKNFSRDNAFQQITNEVGCPFVIKPTDSCGSHGVLIINTLEQFYIAQADIQNYDGPLEVEEFIDGTLYHVDTVIKDGKIIFISANEYTCPNQDYTKGKVLGSIPLDPTSSISDNLTEFTKKALFALGADNLITHMELFVTKNGEIIFLEVSARPPGGLINRAHAINSGVNLMDIDFFLQTNTSITIHPNNMTTPAFWAMFPLKPGKVTKRNPPVLQSQCDLTWFVEEDAMIDVKACKSVVGKAAHAVFYHHDKKILREDFETIKNHQIMETSHE